MRYSIFSSPRLCPRLALLLAWILSSMLVAACGTATPAATPSPTAPAVTATAAPAQGGTPAPAQDGTPAPGGTAAEGGSATSEEDLSVEGVATAVSARTAVPTPTPGPVDRQIREFTTETGLAGRSFLGLTVEDWLNILVSGLVILVGYYVIALLARFSRWIVKRTAPQVNADLLNLMLGYSRWLLVVLLIGSAVLRLEFVSEGLRTTLQDTYLIVVLGIVVALTLAAINLAAQIYRDKLESGTEQRRLTPVIITVLRLAQGVVLIIALSILLGHLGFNVNIIAALLIVSALVISFGAQDVLSDVLSGFIILMDQPFRVGDSILVKELNTRGTVLAVGTRSTQIRTGDNREVIVPNSRIGQSQVINYTYPDSRFRAQTDIGVAYGTDPEEMRRVIEQAVRGVEGVLPDKPVQIYYLKFGDTARLVRVRWWIDTYRDEKKMLDQVNIALELSLDQAGIELPFNTYDLNLRTQDGDSVRLEQSSH
jgi:small-conductance mechanosensitive channel